jgi:hypothetical protein
MASPDVEAIENFEVGYRKATKEFASSEFLWLSDINNGGYSSGTIRYDTLSCSSQFWIPADSYLFMPLTISCANGGTPFATSDPIAFKNSVLDLITGITISTGSGQTLVNDTSIQYINTIRRLIDSSWDAQMTNLNEVQFWKNTTLPPSASASYASMGCWQASSTANLPATQAASNNPAPFTLDAGVIQTVSQTYNEGFERRIRLFKSNASFAGGTFTLYVFLPLRYLHPYFEKLDFPVRNIRFQINFNTPLNNSNAAVIANTPILHTANNAAGAAMSDAQIQISGATYLYYRRVIYEPADELRIGQMLARGHKITIDFPVTDFYGSTALNITPGQNGRTDPVSSATIAPLRIWQLLLPAGYAAGSLANMQQQPFQTNAVVTRGNVLINNQRYYENDLGANGGTSWAHDFFEVLSEQMVSHGYKDNLGSVIGMKDFAGPYNINCYDVTRLKGRISSPSEGVIISVNYSTQSTNGFVTNNSDCIYLVERNITCVMDFSDGGCQIALGAQAP